MASLISACQCYDQHNYLAVCISGQFKPTREEQIGSKLDRTGILK